MCSNLIPTEEDLTRVYPNSDEALMMKVTLAGPDYQFDNKTVWGILTRLVGGGSAWPFIKSLEDTYDGRRAIEILKLQSMGTASTSSRQARAFNVIHTTIYDGKNNRSSFTGYVEKLQYAFTELVDCNVILSEGQKVDYMMQNFDVPQKGNIRGRIINTNLESDFAECCSFISQFLAKTTIYDKPAGAKRAVASISQPSNRVKFTDDEWHALTSEEQERVKVLRKKLKKDMAKATKPKTHKKKVSAVKTASDGDATSDEDVPMKPPAKKKKTE